MIHKVKTFGIRIAYSLIGNKWTELPGQGNIDEKINSWVENTGNLIISVNPAFNNHLVDKTNMYTDFLYIVIYAEADRDPNIQDNLFVGLDADVGD